MSHCPPWNCSPSPRCFNPCCGPANLAWLSRPLVPAFNEEFNKRVYRIPTITFICANFPFSRLLTSNAIRSWYFLFWIVHVCVAQKRTLWKRTRSTDMIAVVVVNGSLVNTIFNGYQNYHKNQQFYDFCLIYFITQFVYFLVLSHIQFYFVKVSQIYKTVLLEI